MRAILLFLFFIICFVSAKSQFFRNYRPGYYYDLSGRKISGLVDLYPSRENVFYKPDEKASSSKIKIEEIKSIIINGDSMVVKSEDGKDNHLYYAKPIFATSNSKIYIKYKFVYTGSTMSTVNTVGMRNGQPVSSSSLTWTGHHSGGYIGLEEHFMYEDGNTTYELKKGNFMEVLSRILTDDTELVKRLQSKVYKFKDLQSVLEMYKNKRSVI